jgi:hypothetical protein
MRFAVIVCLASMWTLVSAQDRLSGSMEMVCIPPPSLDLHLKGASDGSTLVVHMWTAATTDGEPFARHTPHAAKGRWCSADSHCEAVETTITLDKFNLEKEAAGSYEVEFKDGRKQQGKFRVVRTPYKKPFRCL